jgi:hypothetical protein
MFFQLVEMNIGVPKARFSSVFTPLYQEVMDHEGVCGQVRGFGLVRGGDRLGLFTVLIYVELHIFT